ncbi:MAG: protein-disulfide reductase DsbD domain-containing protein [Sphingobacteriales bacterium]
MKKIITTIISLISVIILAQAQILHPVKWSYAAKVTGPNEAVIFIRATIDQGWHIYSTAQQEGGPIKTSFSFKTSKNYMLDGSIAEPGSVTKYEKAFEMNVSYFENVVTFQQKVSLKASTPDKYIVNGTLRYMVCNDHQCLPPEDVSFSIAVK